MNAFQEHMRFSRSDHVASRAVAAAEWGILLGTLLAVILLPVVKWDEFWFCMIFGVGFPLVGIVQSAWNFSSHPVGCDASFQNGILQFAERFSYEEEPFLGPTVSIPLEKCRWRWG